MKYTCVDENGKSTESLTISLFTIAIAAWIVSLGLATVAIVKYFKIKKFDSLGEVFKDTKFLELLDKIKAWAKDKNYTIPSKEEVMKFDNDKIKFLCKYKIKQGQHNVKGYNIISVNGVTLFVYMMQFINGGVSSNEVNGTIHLILKDEKGKLFVKKIMDCRLYNSPNAGKY